MPKYLVLIIVPSIVSINLDHTSSECELFAFVHEASLLKNNQCNLVTDIQQTTVFKHFRSSYVHIIDILNMYMPVYPSLSLCFTMLTSNATG
jgi:hypothetical protein